MRVVSLLSLLVFPALLHAQHVTPPVGWNMRQQSDTFILTPPGIANRLYTYTIFPAGNTHGANISQFTQELIRADLPAIGSTTDTYKLNPVVDQLYSVTYELKDKNGKPVALSYIIYEGDNGNAQVARIVTENNKAFYSPYLKTSLQHFMKLVNWKKNSGKGNAGSEKKEKEKKYTPKKPKVSLAQITAAPGKGLKAADIEGIYINLESAFGVGGFVTQEYNPYLLLKDKSIYKRVHIDPLQLDVQQSKLLEPDQWGTWSRSGNKIIVNWNSGKPSTWSTFHKTLPATNDTKLNGYYRTIGGGGNVAFGGDVITFSQDGITFFENGKYVRGKSSGAMAESDGPYGSHSSKTNSSGTYSVSGNRIILKENNGATTELAFYFFPDKNKQRSNSAIGIGNNVYSKSDNNK